METALRPSFSVAKGIGCFLPRQSKVVFIKASVKSPLGCQSDHMRWPWKPPKMPLRPMDSSSQPISASLGLPSIRSRQIRVI